MPNYSGTPSQEDQMRAVRRQAIEGIKRVSKPKKKAPEAANEMWLMNGPETTDQGGFALAARRVKKRKELAYG